MGLFETKRLVITSPLFVSGSQSRRLIVGLGNIGKKYELTRHNVGFLCVDSLASAYEATWKEKPALKSYIAEIQVGDKKVILIKPTTLMNLSGESVAAVKKFYKLKNRDILVIHDELALPFGSLRLRLGGSSAGHNGIKSVSAAVGEDYGRLRVGISNDHSAKDDAAAFVLKTFSKEEQSHFKALSKEVISLINEFIYSDQFNPDTRKFIQ
jgi:peptidyl-tRNA hydrolase, PTH1 family